MVAVAVYQIPGHKRSSIIAKAMSEGIRRTGDSARVVQSTDFRAPDAEVAVFYGFDASMRKIFYGYRSLGRPVVYVDLGYWGRRDGQGRYSGYHKISVNDRHPTAYFQSRPHNSDRISQFGIKLKPWRPGTFILLAGTSDKGAMVDGFQPEEWERATIKALGQITDRPIVYRPKPSWKGAKPIEGTIFSPRSTEIKDALIGCHAVVTHHSNVAIDGLVEGIPAFCTEGVATAISLSDLSMIDAPFQPDCRQQWLQDISFCQWSVEEMKTGAPWRHLKQEGLIS